MACMKKQIYEVINCTVEEHFSRNYQLQKKDTIYLFPPQQHTDSPVLRNSLTSPDAPDGTLRSGLECYCEQGPGVLYSVVDIDHIAVDLLYGFFLDLNAGR